MSGVNAATKIYSRERSIFPQMVRGIFGRREFRGSIGLPEREPAPLPHYVSWEDLINKVRLTNPGLASQIKVTLEEKGTALTALIPVREAALDKDNVWKVLERRSLREILDLPALDKPYYQHALGDIWVFSGVSVDPDEAGALEGALEQLPVVAASNPEQAGIALGLKFSGEGALNINKWAEATAREAGEKFTDPRDRRSRDVRFVAAVARTLCFKDLPQLVDFLWKVERHLTRERGRFLGRVVARLYKEEQDPLRKEILKILIGRFAPYPAGEVVTAAIKGFGGKEGHQLRPRVELAVKLGLEQYRGAAEKLRCYLEAVEKKQ